MTSQTAMWRSRRTASRVGAASPSPAKPGRTLLYVVERTLRHLHPFAPHVTEELWHALPHEGDWLATAAWPTPTEAPADPSSELEMDVLFEAVRLLRNLRADEHVPADSLPPAWIRRGPEVAALLERQRGTVERLSRVRPLELLAADAPAPPRSGSRVAPFGECYLERSPAAPEESETLAREREKLQALLEKTRVGSRMPASVPGSARGRSGSGGEGARARRAHPPHRRPHEARRLEGDCPMTSKVPRKAARARPVRRPTSSPTRPSPPPIDDLPLAHGKKPHPALGLGLWGIGRWKPEEEARTKATIGRAYELGFRWFDTAEVYGGGRSERVLGDVLTRAAGGLRTRSSLRRSPGSTFGPRRSGPSSINSLERLGRSTVDLYLVHAPDARVPLADTMGALEGLWKEGRVGAIGVSNFGLEELEEAAKHLSEARVWVNQVRYNLFDRDEFDPSRDYCAKHGILIEAYTPLARGILTGRVSHGMRVPPEVKRFARCLEDEDHLQSVLDRARSLKALADEAGVPLASVCAPLAGPERCAPIVGMSRPDQVDANLTAWRTAVPDRVLTRADALARGDRA